MLEAGDYSDNAFVTLTYDDEHLVFAPGDLPELSPLDVQLFLKRLRKAYQTYQERLRINDVKRFRFYLAGEYGDENWRPHYHVAFFNFPTCVRGRTRQAVGSSRRLWRGCCPVCELVGETWGKGDVDLGVLETDSAQYVAGYVTKKMTRRDDPRLSGRHPEFSRMSNRPGIGANAMHEYVDAHLKFNLDERMGDVPVTLRHGSRELPLGRYLRRKMREYLGRDPKCPEDVIREVSEKMLPLRLAARASKTSPTFKAQILKDSVQRRRKFYAKLALKRKGRHL